MYKRQTQELPLEDRALPGDQVVRRDAGAGGGDGAGQNGPCLLYTSDAADERSSVDLGGRRIIKKKNIIGTDRCIEITRHLAVVESTRR